MGAARFARSSYGDRVFTVEAVEGRHVGARVARFHDGRSCTSKESRDVM